MENKYQKIENLVALAKDNDRQALLDLYETFLPYLKSWFSKLNIKQYTFEDISQEYFLWLVSAIKKYKGSSTFTPYLTKTIKNNLFMIIRKKHMESSTELTFLIQDNYCLEDLLINKIDLLNLIENAKTLNDIERRVLKDYYFNDLTLYCISSRLEKKYSTTAKIKSSALVKLYNCIEEKKD